MPLHDWTRVDAGIYHDFHCSWITHLKEGLNTGLLPEGYYARAEQNAIMPGPHGGRIIADVLTLERPGITPAGARSALALAEAPPRVGRRLVAEAVAVSRVRRRTLAIRHVSGHRVVALIEIASPGNKDRARSVEEFTDKVREAIESGVHVLLVDPFPPGPHDPTGLHGAIWDSWDEAPYDPTPGRPPTLASYLARPFPEAFVSDAAVGEPLPEMPLFLDDGYYINLPLEPSYTAAYRGMGGLGAT